MLLSSSSRVGRSLTNLSLTHWRSNMALGNQAFLRKDFPLAMDCYHRACKIAAELFGRIDDAEAGVAALVVAHHNLADVYEQMDAPSEQGTHLQAVYQFLCAEMNNPDLDEPWRAAALRHSRRAYIELVRFAKQHPNNDQVRDALSLGASGPTFNQRPH